MVDRTDLQEVNNLYREFGQIEQALKNLDTGGDIASFVVTGATPEEPSAILSTAAIRDKFPPQMIEMIVALYIQREQEISSRLSELGMTGVQPQPRAAAPRSRKK